MANKKLSQKERKAQEQVRKEAKRQETGWQSEEPSRVNKRGLLSRLMRDDEKAGAENMMEVILQSYELAYEPELAEFFFDLTQTITLYIKYAEEQEMPPETIEGLPEEEQIEAMMGIVSNMLPHLLTNKIRQEIAECLDAIMERCEAEGRIDTAVQASLVHMILTDRKVKEMWPELPLLVELTHRSIDAAFVWMDVSENDLAVVETLTPDTVLSSPIGQKISNLLNRIPGLRHAAEKEADRVWDEGMAALRDGELKLDLFTIEEFEEGLRIVASNLKIELATDASDFDQKAAANEMQQFYARVLTSERIAHIQQQVQEIVDSGDAEPHYLPFLVLLADELAQLDDMEENEILFATIFFGQLTRLNIARRELDK